MDSTLFLQQTLPVLSRALTVDLFEYELSLIKEVEKTLDPKKLFEEKWKIATSGDRHALARYHSKLLSKKVTKINESINKLTESQRFALDNKLESFRGVLIEILKPIQEHLKLLVNEQDLNFGAAVDNVDFSKLEKGVQAASSSAPSSWTIMGVINSIGKALTGNYSILGIFQLFLDIVGIFGDYFVPGLGMVADLINATIYFINGEYVLGVISLVAIVPLFGDIAKFAKPVAGPLQKIFGFLFNNKTQQAGQAIASSPAAANVITRFVLPAFKSLGNIFTSAGIIVTKLLNKLTGWIPFGIGKGIKTFFDYIQNSILKLKDKINGVDSVAREALDLAAKSAKLVDPKVAKSIKDASSKMLKGGGEIIDDGVGDMIKFKYADGTEEAFKRSDILGAEAFDKKFPGATKTVTQGTTTTTTSPLVGPTGLPITNTVTSPDITAFAYVVSKNKSTPKFSKFINLFSKKWNRMSLIGFGKLIYKYMYGKDPEGLKIEGTDVPLLDDADYAYVSSAALTDYVQQTIEARKKQTGEIYNPTVVFNSLDAKEKDGFDFTQSYIRDMARKTGQPSIIPVIYDKYKTEMDSNTKEAMQETFSTLSKSSLGEPKSKEEEIFRGISVK